jgi:hypothetical protein
MIYKFGYYKYKTILTSPNAEVGNGSEEVHVKKLQWS